MGFFEDRGDLGPPPDPFRIDRGRDRFHTPPRMLRWFGLGAAILVLVVVLNVAKSIYVDVLWFDSVDYGGVYRRAIRLLLRPGRRSGLPQQHRGLSTQVRSGW